MCLYSTEQLNVASSVKNDQLILVFVLELILFTGGENFVALDLIVQHVHSQLEKVRVPQSVSVSEPAVNRFY